MMWFVPYYAIVGVVSIALVVASLWALGHVAIRVGDHFAPVSRAKFSEPEVVGVGFFALVILVIFVAVLASIGYGIARALGVQ